MDSYHGLCKRTSAEKAKRSINLLKFTNMGGRGLRIYVCKIDINRNKSYVPTLALVINRIRSIIGKINLVIGKQQVCKFLRKFLFDNFLVSGF